MEFNSGFKGLNSSKKNGYSDFQLSLYLGIDTRIKLKLI